MNSGNHVVWKSMAAGAAGGLVASWIMGRFESLWSAAAKDLSNENEQDAGQKPDEDATVKTARTSIDWIAYATDSGLDDGMGQGLAVSQDCNNNPPPKKCPSGTTWKDKNHNGKVDNGECISKPSNPGHHFPPPSHHPQSGPPPLAQTGTTFPIGLSIEGALALLAAGAVFILAGRRRKVARHAR